VISGQRILVIRVRKARVVASTVQFSESRRNIRERGATVPSFSTRLGNSALKNTFQDYFILL